MVIGYSKMWTLMKNQTKSYAITGWSNVFFFFYTFV